MTWFSHKILTASMVWAVTGNNVAALFAAVGSVLPDAVEGSPSGGNIRQWRKNHRQISHWFIPYLIVSVVILGYAYHNGADLDDITLKKYATLLRGDSPDLVLLGGFVFIGAVLHCVQDAICGKIPGINPKNRIGICIFTVRSINEYLFVFVVGSALLFFRSAVY